MFQNKIQLSKKASISPFCKKMDFDIVAVNCDHTNRPFAINRPDTLAQHVVEIYDGELYPHMLYPDMIHFPSATPTTNTRSMLTTTESSKTASNAIGELLDCDHYGARFTTRDYSAIFLHNMDPWLGNEEIGQIWSDRGKYCAIVLDNEETRKKLIYTTVHLPHDRERRAEANRLLLQFLEEGPLKYEADGCLIAGDFNMNPSRLRDIFPNICYNLGIGPDNLVPTTRAGNSIDNIVSTDNILVNINIRRDKDYLFTHYPMVGNVSFKDFE